MFLSFRVVIRRFSRPGIQPVITRNQRPEIRTSQFPAEYITNHILYLCEEQSSEKCFCQYN